MELVQIYLKKSNEITIITGTNLLSFFLFLFQKISLLDPDPHFEC